MIQPAIGRIVWYRHQRADRAGQPLAALITWVHSERLINICAFDAGGVTVGILSVVLIQDNDPIPPLNYAYCEWPHHQKALQAKAIEEAGVAAAAAASRLESSTPVEPAT